MVQEIQEQIFSDGFAIGALTGRLKYQAPSQLREWVPLDKLNSFKGVLQKYNYAITGLTTDPNGADQVLLVAEKTAQGTNPNLVQAFTQGDRFMDGWHTGCLSGMLLYTQPDQFEEWVKVDNLDAIQKLMDQYHYTISSLKVHPEDKRWILVVACKKLLA